MSRSFLLVLSLIWSVLTFGQSERVPLPLTLFDRSIPYINPSDMVFNQGVHFGTQNQFGAFSEIRSHYLYASYVRGSNEIKDHRSRHRPDGYYNKQAIGLAINSFQEGVIIAEHRVKFSYWRKISLSKEIELVAGAQLGVINNRIDATKSTSGASEWSPDIDLGMTLITKPITIGTSFNQVASPEVTPLTQSITYGRYLSAHARHNYDLKSSWKLISTVYYQTELNLGTVFLAAKSSLEYGKIYFVDFGISNQGLLFGLGAKLKVDRMTVASSLGYQVSTFLDSELIYNPLQIHIGITRGARRIVRYWDDPEEKGKRRKNEE